MIEGPVLVLNRSYTPIHITSIKKAICLVFRGVAKIVDDEYRSYDFKSWSELTVAMSDESIHLTNKNIKVPRVIMLQFYEKLPFRHVRFTRENVYLRDQNTCQYCYKKFKRADLNLDHVVPVSQGGKTSWDNVVCSCISCNSKKGGRTPEQAKLKILRKPQAPQFSLFMRIAPKSTLFETWRVYMNTVDFAYWNLDLMSD